jgi:hypothetical protein
MQEMPSRHRLSADRDRADRKEIFPPAANSRISGRREIQLVRRQQLGNRISVLRLEPSNGREEYHSEQTRKSIQGIHARTLRRRRGNSSGIRQFD